MIPAVPTTPDPPAAATPQDSAERWSAVLAQFEAGTRGDAEFVPPDPADGEDPGPKPIELRALAAELLAACDARIEAVQAEMDGVSDELATLQQAGRSPRGRQYRSTAVADGSTGIGHIA